jgi:hypothetical protein
MADDRADKVDRARKDVLDKGLTEEEKRLRDPHGRPPHSEPERLSESSAADPERPVTPAEKANDDIAHLENPPQAEGPRERSNRPPS